MKSTKVTCAPSRSYGDACAMAHALELVGERWSLLVVRELMLGPRRFSELRQELPLISANILSQRLEGLAALGLVEKQWLPPPASVQVYRLTEWGLALEPVLFALGRWALRSPLHDPTLPFSGASLALSLRAMFDGKASGIRRMDVALRVGRDRYVAKVRARRLTVSRNSEVDADAELEGRAEALARLIYGIEPFELLIAGGEVSISGDLSTAGVFLACFPRLGVGP